MEKRVFVKLLCFVLAIFLGVGLLYYVSNLERKFYEEEIQDSKGILEAIAYPLTNTIHALKESLYSASQLLTAFDLRGEELKEVLMSLYRAHERSVYLVGRVSKDGIVTDTYPLEPEMINRDLSGRLAFKRLQVYRIPTVGDVFFLSAGRNGVGIYVPVFKERAVFDGALFCIINYKAMLFDVLDPLLLSFSTPWHYLVLDDRGVILLGGKGIGKVFTPLACYGERICDFRYLLHRLFSGESEGVLELKEVGGDVWQFSYRRIPLGTGSNWYVLLYALRDKMLGESRSIFLVLRISIVVLMAVSSLMILYFHREEREFPEEAELSSPHESSVEVDSLRKRVTELSESLKKSEKERQRIKEVLEKSQKLFSGLVVEVDSSLRILSASDSVRDIGFDPEELKGKNLLEIFAPDERKSIKIVIKNLEGELRIKGKVYQLKLGALENGRFLFVGTDVTEQRKKEERLEESWRLAILGEALASVVHDIAQPISAIKASVYFLKKKLAGKAPDLNERLQSIEENLKRVDNILTRLREFASGGRQLGMERFNLNDLVKDVIEGIVAPKIEGNEIELKLDLAEDLPSLRGDPYRIEEVLVNLLSNAVSAVEKAPKKVITIRTRYLRDRASVLLEVSDTGGGVPEEIADKIFDTFFTTKEKKEGTGMGLSISRKIVEEHGGKIYFRNNSEGGVTFYVEIPIHPP